MRSKFALSILAVAPCLCLVGAVPALGQCILANPSFEIAGSSGPVFGGWNQFGNVGSVTLASHGHRAARVSGPNNGTWDVSGYWQPQDCIPGEQWAITGHVLVPSGNPLTGQNTALVNIEWRDSADSLIDYDSFTVANAGSPLDEYLEFALLSTPAPAGTVKARLLVGNLQSPTDPPSDVYFDQVTFFSTSSPTIDELQWNDFPGGRTVTFGDYTWRVKGTGYYGPGPNTFTDSPTRVWVDDSGQLHLTLTKSGSTWYSTEIATEQALGYGDYILTTVGSLDQLDPQAVLGIFLWEYGPCWDDSGTWWGAFNEIDIEYSRWENPDSDLAQFVAQPYDWSGNISRFDAAFGANEVVSHAMRWLADRVEYRVWRGGPHDEATSDVVHSWTYNGPHIPRPEQPRMHLNLWRISGELAADQEIVFTDFYFVPESSASAVRNDRIPARTSAPAGRLYPAAPNPFNPQTVLRFELARDQFVELQIYDLNGRLVRTLASDFLATGEHSRTWDGRSNGGRSMASGVYLQRLRGLGFQESRRIMLLK
jgi:FlgD Ig-like domain